MTKKRKNTNARAFGRRGALKGLAGVSVGTLVGCAPEASVELGSSSSALAKGKGKRPRVAIIGAGMGGLSTAYFLDGACDVEIFEARDKIGGNCDSPTVEYEGQTFRADLGAQFFTPGSHPIYVTLLEELGLFDPESPATDEVVEATGGLTVFPIEGGMPVVASPQPFAAPKYLFELAQFAGAIRNAVVNSMPWELALGSWIDALPLTEGFKAEIARPWMSSLIGAPQAQALTASARSLLQTFALAFPENIFQPSVTNNSKIGLEGNLEHLLDATQGATVRLNTKVTALTQRGPKWWVTTGCGGKEGPFDAVVVNAPAHVSKQLLAGVASASDIVALLEQFVYFEARIVIHTDPAYVHAERQFWGTYNLGIDGAECEGSVWLAPFHDKLPSGGTIDVFKSWAMRRRADPANILHERRFLHPLYTPESLPAIRGVAQLNGRDGLYFSGSHYNTFDLQESAVYGGLSVARMLAPESQTVASLDARLAARGRSGISYEL